MSLKQRKVALRRLMADLREINNNPIPCVSALPVDAVLIEQQRPETKPQPSSPLKISALVAGSSTHGWGAAQPVQLAVACMTKQPLAFRTWLEYYRTELRVCRFYIRVEDTPQLLGRVRRLSA